MAQKSFPFSNAGVITKVQSGEKPQGGLDTAINIESLQEGSISSRSGRKRVGAQIAFPSASPGAVRKVRIGSTDSANPRYVLDQLGNVFRTTNLFATTPSFASAVSDMTNRGPSRFNVVDFPSGESTQQTAFISGSLKMLKDSPPGSGTALTWGILPAVGVCTAVVAGAGALDGGATGSPAGSSPYDWIFTYRDNATGNESNPSLPMAPDSAVANGVPLAIHLKSVTVTVWGTGDPKITGANSIALYRRGGIFTDGLYRFVGYITNPGVGGGGVPNSTTFLDNAPDVSLEFARTVEFDNDPPVTSQLPKPFVANIGATLTGFQTYTLSSPLPAGVGVGALVTVAQDQGVIAVVNSPTSIVIYLQRIYVNVWIQIFAATGQACPYSCTAFDSLFLAGDINNPHLLYKSKSGRPESFPLVNVDGSSNVVQCGTPENPIQNILEFRDFILTMNLSSFFVVPIIAGIMQLATEVPVASGLVFPWAWDVQSRQLLWYLGQDGFYVFDGGVSEKVSEQIETVFTGRTLNGLLPIDYTRSAFACNVSYHRHEIYLHYIAPDANAYDLRFQSIYKRWLPENYGTLLLQQEEDVSNLLMFSFVDNYFSFADLDGPSGSTDDWVTTGLEGVPIPCGFKTGFFSVEGVALSKLFQDIILELDCPSPTPNSQQVVVNIYYDYATTPGDAIGIADNASAGVAGRHRVSLLSQFNQPISRGKECFAVAFEFIWSCSQRTTFYSLHFEYEILAAVQTGKEGMWDNMGHPFDKRIQEVTIEWTNYGFASFQAQLDIMSGLDSLAQTLAVAVFPLPVTPVGARGLRTFALPDGVICKLARISLQAGAPAGAGTTIVENSQLIRIYGVKYTQINDPPDIVLFTEWKQLNPCESIGRRVLMTIDTGNVAATIQPQADGVNKGPAMVVTTTDTDRRRFIAMDSDLIGSMWRALLTPGTGGKTKLWSLDFEVIAEPCAGLEWDSYEQQLGVQGWKFIKLFWLQYVSPGALSLTLYRDNKQLLYNTTLPPHVNRDLEKVPIPSANAGALNKSKQYRVFMSGSFPFKFYVDASRIEYGVVGANRRMAFQQKSLTEVLQIPAV